MNNNLTDKQLKFLEREHKRIIKTAIKSLKKFRRKQREIFLKEKRKNGTNNVWGNSQINSTKNRYSKGERILSHGNGQNEKTRKLH